jgi:pimeloyl-ACP methyl ester carboxylesterase
MNSTFYHLLDNTMAEVCRREPAYTSAFPMAFASKGAASAYAQHPLWDKLPPDEVEHALNEGVAYMTKGWTKATESSTGSDPVAQFLCDCTFDALCADQGLLGLQPHSESSAPIADVLAQEYTLRRTAAGLGYYVRNRGARPLLLINATGAPIGVWTQFLADAAHDFKLILPQRRGSDLFRGGLQQHVDIQTDSADLASVLDAESLEQSDVLAWCNGARVALDFATSRESRIASMVLLGPMLKGIKNVTPKPSSFERDLQPLLDAVSKDTSLAPFLAEVIAKQPGVPDWERWVNAPARRAQALFALPAKDHANAMIAMLTEPESFINIARRVASDESYPMDQALGKLETRTMVIMGSDDSIVSNQLVLAAMKQICRNPIPAVVLRGSGHYIHDLQYHYFRWLLTEFLGSGRLPEKAARISVERLGRS